MRTGWCVIILGLELNAPIGGTDHSRMSKRSALRRNQTSATCWRIYRMNESRRKPATLFRFLATIFQLGAIIILCTCGIQLCPVEHGTIEFHNCGCAEFIRSANTRARIQLIAGVKVWMQKFKKQKCTPHSNSMWTLGETRSYASHGALNSKRSDKKRKHKHDSGFLSGKKSWMPWI